MRLTGNNSRRAAPLVALVILLALSPQGCSAPGDRVTVGAGDEVVVLVHGLWRSHRALWPLRDPLLEAGYRVIDHRYKSTRAGIVENASGLRNHLEEIASEPAVKQIHVVGHSLGAILARVATDHPVPPKTGRVVQISPPNQGSPWASTFEGLLDGWVDPIGGLSDEAGSLVRSLGPPAVETGIIAGSSDPIVPVENTRLEGAADWIELPGSHTFIFWKRNTQQQVVHFLRHGSFRR